MAETAGAHSTSAMIRSATTSRCPNRLQRRRNGLLAIRFTRTPMLATLNQRTDEKNAYWVPYNPTPGIHRGKYQYLNDSYSGSIKELYLDSDAKSYMEMMRPVFGQVADYFEEMGVSADILELIKTVSSSQIRILIQDELERWGLGFKNVVAEELVDKI